MLSYTSFRTHVQLTTHSHHHCVASGVASLADPVKNCIEQMLELSCKNRSLGHFSIDSHLQETSLFPVVLMSLNFCVALQEG